MGAHRVVVLTCDHDVSGPCYVRLVTPYAMKTKAREAAAENGWTSRGDRDMCPSHDFPGPIYETTGSSNPSPRGGADG